MGTDATVRGRGSYALDGAAIALALFALSLLAWSGRPHSGPEIARYALGDSLARYGRWDIESVRWLGPLVGDYGPDGLFYGRDSIGLSLMTVPLLLLGLRIPDIGPMHIVLLLIPLFHALTGVLLYRLALYLFPAAGRRGALAVTLLWAIASPALPYVRGFFTEPISALALIGALSHLTRYRDRESWLDVAGAGIWLGLALLVQLSNLLFLPLFALALLLYAQRHWLARPVLEAHGQRPALSLRASLAGWQLWFVEDWFSRRLFFFLLPSMAMLALHLWYHWYRLAQLPGALLDLGGTYLLRALPGLYHVLVSPGRGVLWYLPWLLLAIVGGRRAWQRDKVLVALALACTLVMVVGLGPLAGADDFEWGPRRLLPIFPLLALLVTPLWEPTSARLRAEVWFLSVLSLLVTLVGVIWGYDRRPFQAAWLLEGAVGDRLIVLLVAIALIGGGAGAWAWWRRNGTVLVLGLLLVFVGLWLFLGDLRAFQIVTLRQALATLPGPFPAGSQILYDDARLARPLLNHLKARVPVTGFDVRESALPAREESRLRAIAATAEGPLFVVSAGREPFPNRLDELLLQRLTLIGSRTMGRYRITEYRPEPP